MSNANAKPDNLRPTTKLMIPPKPIIVAIAMPTAAIYYLKPFVITISYDAVWV